MTLPLVTDVTNLRGTRVLVRASLNVPVQNGVVHNDFRIRRALPTIEYLMKAGARIILIGHIGRDTTETLHPVYEAFRKYIELKWCPELLGEHAHDMVAALGEGEVVMLENLRQHAGEKENDDVFTQALAGYADLYVNDAFPASHRHHASIVGVPRHLPHYAGVTFGEEYRELQRAMKPQSPSLFILGGAKFETKLPLVERYAHIYDHVFIGGALANDVLRAQGFPIGASVVSDIDLTNTHILEQKNILIPVDVTVKSDVVRVTTPADVKPDEYIYDAGPKTMKLLEPLIREAETILWNGPLGYFEGGFAEYTKQCAEAIARSRAYSIVGGGDSIAAIESLGLQPDFDFVSTAGGAMLVFLEEGTLPGIDALTGSS